MLHKEGLHKHLWCVTAHYLALLVKFCALWVIAGADATPYALDTDNVLDRSPRLPGNVDALIDNWSN